MPDVQDRRGALARRIRAREFTVVPRQPHINLLIYQHVRRVTIIQVNSKKGAIWKTNMDQYRFSSEMTDESH